MKVLHTEEQLKVTRLIDLHQAKRNRLGNKMLRYKSKLEKTRNPVLMWWYAWVISGLEIKIRDCK